MNEHVASQGLIVIERIFNAPIEQVWKMWTQPEHFKAWYGPEGFSVPSAEMDVRVGGKHLICMERATPQGRMKLWTTGTYREVTPYTRLVYTDSMTDEHGNAMPPADGAEYPTTTEVVVVLEDLNGRTKMVMTHSGIPGGGDGASEGWKQSFNKLDVYLVSYS